MASDRLPGCPYGGQPESDRDRPPHPVVPSGRGVLEGRGGPQPHLHTFGHPIHPFPTISTQK
jgi:hypothetical protein